MVTYYTLYIRYLLIYDIDSTISTCVCVDIRSYGNGIRQLIFLPPVSHDMILLFNIEQFHYTCFFSTCSTNKSMLLK